MGNGLTDSLRSTLRLYRLPEDAGTQQPLLERAEEDLLCALSLYRRGACGYLPLVTVCFLLHQAIEKWLKVFIAVQGIPMHSNRPHDLLSRLEAATTVQPAFAEIQSKIEEIGSEIMEHKFPGNLRYNDAPPDIERYIQVLVKTAFEIRKLVKRTLQSKLEGIS